MQSAEVVHLPPVACRRTLTSSMTGNPASGSGSPEALIANSEKTSNRAKRKEWKVSLFFRHTVQIGCTQVQVEGKRKSLSSRVLIFFCVYFTPVFSSRMNKIRRRARKVEGWELFCTFSTSRIPLSSGRKTREAESYVRWARKSPPLDRETIIRSRYEGQNIIR